MFHKNRTWSIAKVESVEALAEKLVDCSWTLCTGFELQGYLFVNDSLSEDGAQEFAVVRRPECRHDPWKQVESITFSWCTKEQARRHIERSINGDFDIDGNNVEANFEDAEKHTACMLCR